MRLGAADGELSRALAALLRGYGLEVRHVAAEAIPGSYWGECEAGLVGAVLFVRADTPLHSALHEACHHICADDARRAALDTDAGGEVDEECGVCYLQVLLAPGLPGAGRARMFADMDAWGYSFRLGNARDWFEQDADDARAWLQTHGVIDADERPTGRCATLLRSVPL
ncbi:MAG TPA: hypothetical protein PJ986_03590 [Gammaproteobacteria bacterium]|nr:hypothetical protein [Gammaproteobacteria bacterium]